ncbi:hypothetical protein O0I10_011804 [Lichtheimia ornata]|uniref:Uncharacterized protein n=1 Tax=Lichtheimia ornata TaxID=688661 RepID=A0AAD7UU70_9FUNG|nr:uncharacterized protein O0I10_011804 [Lichtheimia ornata]KAJ8652545.1 hypothetical protein O0I10_011804 [Lichtheimia ornata]
MHQGRYSSSALLLLFASIMVGFIAPPVVAVKVHLSKSKEEALAYCDGIKFKMSNGEYSQEVMHTYQAVYPDQQGNDVFYHCGDRKEYPTDVNRSKKDCKSAATEYKETPNKLVHYECLSDGGWALVDCSPHKGRIICRYPERDEYLQNHPEEFVEYLKKDDPELVEYLKEAHPELFRNLEKGTLNPNDVYELLHADQELGKKQLHSKTQPPSEHVESYFKDAKLAGPNVIDVFDYGTQTN